jgi:hypothetical protein
MNIFDIRKENYRRLQAEFRLLPQEQKIASRHGELSRFGAFTGVKARFLTHVNSGIKRLGPVSCHKMEMAFKKTPGWMDEEHSAAVKSASHSGTAVPSQGISEEDFLSQLRGRLEGASPIEVDRILTYLIVVEERKRAEANARVQDGAK